MPDGIWTSFGPIKFRWHIITISFNKQFRLLFQDNFRFANMVFVLGLWSRFGFRCACCRYVLRWSFYKCVVHAVESPCLNRYARLTWHNSKKAFNNLSRIDSVWATKKRQSVVGYGRLSVCACFHFMLQPKRRNVNERSEQTFFTVPFLHSAELEKIRERRGRGAGRLSRKYRRRQQQWPQLLMILPLTLKKKEQKKLHF